MRMSPREVAMINRRETLSQIGTTVLLRPQCRKWLLPKISKTSACPLWSASVQAA